MTFVLRLATQQEISRWDDLVLANPGGGEIFQSSSFAAVKAEGTWHIQHMIYEAADQSIAALYLVKSFSLVGRQFYCPMGPTISQNLLSAIVEANQTYARAHKDIFVFKLEPELAKDTQLAPSTLRIHPIQPHSAVTCIVKFNGDEDALFMSYKSRARNLIRNAEKNMVEVRTVDSSKENISKMFALYVATGERNDFFVRPYSYYQKFWSQFAADDRGQMFFAERDGQLLAAGYVIWFGTKSYHKDGGSLRGVPLYNAPYLMQWYMQRWLLHKGIKTYEMIGVPPPDKLADKGHPLYNLGVFKTAFNPVITEMLGTIDQVTNHARYKRWQQFGQKVANRVARHVRHDNLY